MKLYLLGAVPERHFHGQKINKQRRGFESTDERINLNYYYYIRHFKDSLGFKARLDALRHAESSDLGRAGRHQAVVHLGHPLGQAAPEPGVRQDLRHGEAPPRVRHQDARQQFAAVRRHGHVRGQLVIHRHDALRQGHA